MTISRVNFGGVQAGTSGPTATPPAGIADDDLVLVLIGDKYVAPNTPTSTSIVNPWTLSSNGQGSGGAGAPGVDSGTAFASCYQRVAVLPGDAGTNALCTITGGNTSLVFQVAFRSDLVAAGTHQWSVECAQGSDNSVDTSWSVTGDVDPGIETGDYVIAYSVTNGNGPGVGFLTAEALSCAGVTFGSVFTIGDAFTSNGDDCAVNYTDAIATAGQSSAPPVYTMTASTATGAQGATIFIRIREIQAVDASAAFTFDPMTLVAMVDLPAELDVPPIWTLPEMTLPSPPTLTPVQALFGRDIRFREDFTITPAKDWAVVDGLDAVKQSILNEAMTSPGEFALRPEYGMGLADAVKRPSSRSVLDALINRVRDRLARNPRVTRVKEVAIESVAYQGGVALRVSIRVEAAGRDLGPGTGLDPLVIGAGGVVG